jgi:hypothetical protein
LSSFNLPQALPNITSNTNANILVDNEHGLNEEGHSLFESYNPPSIHGKNASRSTKVIYPVLSNRKFPYENSSDLEVSNRFVLNNSMDHDYTEKVLNEPSYLLLKNRNDTLIGQRYKYTDSKITHQEPGSTIQRGPNYNDKFFDKDQVQDGRNFQTMQRFHYMDSKVKQPVPTLSGQKSQHNKAHSTRDHKNGQFDIAGNDLLTAQRFHYMDSKVRLPEVNSSTPRDEMFKHSFSIKDQNKFQLIQDDSDSQLAQRLHYIDSKFRLPDASNRASNYQNYKPGFLNQEHTQLPSFQDDSHSQSPQRFHFMDSMFTKPEKSSHIQGEHYYDSFIINDQDQGQFINVTQISQEDTKLTEGSQLLAQEQFLHGSSKKSESYNHNKNAPDQNHILRNNEQLDDQTQYSEPSIVKEDQSNLLKSMVRLKDQNLHLPGTVTLTGQSQVLYNKNSSYNPYSYIHERQSFDSFHEGREETSMKTNDNQQLNNFQSVENYHSDSHQSNFFVPKSNQPEHYELADSQIYQNALKSSSDNSEVENPNVLQPYESPPLIKEESQLPFVNDHFQLHSQVRKQSPSSKLHVHSQNDHKPSIENQDELAFTKHQDDHGKNIPSTSNQFDLDISAGVFPEELSHQQSHIHYIPAPFKETLPEEEKKNTITENISSENFLNSDLPNYDEYHIIQNKTNYPIQEEAGKYGQVHLTNDLLAGQDQERKNTQIIITLHNSPRIQVGVYLL